jgi:hypothetical protein
MAREVRLWEWLKDNLRGTEGLHMRRVENLVSEGDPDVDGCWLGRYFELELKGCDRPVKDGLLNFDVRQSQVIWHRRRWKCGGNVWLYIRVGKGREIKRYLIPGSLTGRVREGVTEAQLAELSVLPCGHSATELLQQAIDTSKMR